MQHRSDASAHSDPDLQLLSFCSGGRQEYQSTPGISKQVTGSFFKFDQKLSRLRILNRMLHAGTIYFCIVIGPVGQIRATQLAFWMCSTKSLTSVISSFSIKKLSALSSAASNFTIIGRIFRQPDLRVFFAGPSLRSNHYVGGRPHHDEPVGTSFE